MAQDGDGPHEFNDFVSTDTKHTTRNLLIAGSITIFAIVFDLSLHELKLVEGVIGKGSSGDRVVKIGLAVLLVFLIVSHFLNWYGDWIRYSEWRALVHQPRIDKLQSRIKTVSEQISESRKRLAKVRAIPAGQDTPGEGNLPSVIPEMENEVKAYRGRLERLLRHGSRSAFLIYCFHAWLPLGLGTLGVVLLNFG